MPTNVDTFQAMTLVIPVTPGNRWAARMGSLAKHHIHICDHSGIGHLVWAVLDVPCRVKDMLLCFYLHLVNVRTMKGAL